MLGLSPLWNAALHAGGDPVTMAGGVYLANAATGLLLPPFPANYTRSGPDLWCPQDDGSYKSFAANVIPREWANGRWGFRFDPGFVNSCLWGDEQTVARGWLSDTSPVVGEDSLTPPMFGGTYTKHTSTGSGAPKVYRSATVTPGQIVTMSALVRLGTMPAASFTMAFFDETAGGFISTQIVPATAPNSSGWTRVDATITVPAGCTSLRFYPFRNGSAHTGGTFYIAAVNLTNTAYPVPLTVAQGTAGTVSVPTLQMLLSDASITLGSEYTFGVEYEVHGTVAGHVLRVDDGADNNRSLFYANAAGAISYSAKAGGATVYNQSAVAANGTLIKSAARIKANNIRVANNGLLAAASGAAAVPIGQTWLRAPNLTSVRIGRMWVAPTRALTDTELQAVTA